MTPNEYRKLLLSLTEQQVKELEREFGGGYLKDRETHVRNFTDHPEWENRLCYLANALFNIDQLTEYEKLVAATVANAEAARISALASKESADAAKESLQMARESESDTRKANRISLISAIAAVASVIVSIVLYFAQP